MMIDIGIHLKQDPDERIVLEYVEAHDSNTEAYFRLRFGFDVTIYLSDAQRKQLMGVLAQGAQEAQDTKAPQTEESPLASGEELTELRNHAVQSMKPNPGWEKGSFPMEGPYLQVDKLR